MSCSAGRCRWDMDDGAARDAKIIQRLDFASDAMALVNYTQQAVFLNDGECGRLRRQERNYGTSTAKSLSSSQRY